MYVLDFWATWCGPCVASIPHINELQQKYRDQDLHVIGVAVWPNQRMTPTAQFVEAKGDDMDYWIAEDVENKTADAYMRASEQSGIPTAFIIDKSGKVAWIGHPMDGLDDIVELVVKDQLSEEALKSLEEKRAAAQAESEKLVQAMEQAYMGSDWAGVARVAEEMLALDPERFSAAGVYRYMAMVKLGTDDRTRKEARTYGVHLISNLYSEDSESLNALAWYIVRPENDLDEDEMDAEFAVMVAEKAAKLTKHEDPNILDTLARAYYVDGQVQRAIETQEAAIEAAGGFQPMVEQLQARMVEYKEAVSGN